MSAEVLRLEGVTVCVGGQTLLQNLHLTLQRGEALGVHSGQASVKQALVDAVTGAVEAAEGRIYLEGEPCLPEARPRRRAAKVAVIRSQEALIDSLTVAENIFVIRRNIRTWRVSRALLEDQTRKLMAELGFSFPAEAPVSRLTPVERCLLQGIKAYALGARVLILQDLSSFLADAGIARLRELTLVLRGQGMGILAVDSSPEVLGALADPVVILRQGITGWRLRGPQCVLEENRLCFEDPLGDSGTDQAAAPALGHGAALSFEAVCVEGAGPLSFTLESGGGLLLLDRGGSAIDRVRRCLTGESAPLSGTIRTAKGLLRHGGFWRAPDPQIALVPENPGEAALFPDLTALENLCGPLGGKLPGFWLNPSYRRSCLQEYEGYFEAGALKSYPEQLSRGDRQRLAYLRWHLYNPAVVVCIRPFSSVDPALNAVSAECIRLLRRKGIAVLVLATNDSAVDLGLRKLEVPKNAPLQPKNAL